ncbi:phosphotransferase [Streptomyces levis]|uniref:phosphotransferase n=1 Tax=Streptomyces levis TaxID=285566 RepID=UPI003C7D22FB
MPTDQDHRTARRVGDAGWVREALARHWGPAWGAVPPRPLGGKDGPLPLSHTAGLWRVEHRGATHLFKVQLEPAASRGPAFPKLKHQVMAHCAARGVPLARAVPTLSGAPAAWQDGHPCEVVPFVAGTAAPAPSPAQADAVTGAGLALRAALDEVPTALAGQLAPVRLPRLVAEEDWRRALADAEARLLPMARRRTDGWGRAAARALSALVDAAPMLHAAGALDSTPDRLAVVHGDLHHHHFLLDDRPRVAAVLDFDNLHVGDRLLDLAWIAETAGRVPGGADRTREALTRFRDAAQRAGLAVDDHLPLLMPVLVAHAAPVVVDIAKDILERDILTPAWLSYFELLDTARRTALHRLLTG